MKVTIDTFGRIVIPKTIRDDLGLDPGTVLEVEPTERGVVLRVRSQDPYLSQEGGVLVFTGRPAGALQPRQPGGWRGRMWIAEDFDAPLPAETLNGFDAPADAAAEPGQADEDS